MPSANRLHETRRPQCPFVDQIRKLGHIDARRAGRGRRDGYAVAHRRGWESRFWYSERGYRGRGLDPHKLLVMVDSLVPKFQSSEPVIAPAMVIQDQ